MDYSLYNEKGNYDNQVQFIVSLWSNIFNITFTLKAIQITN